MAAFPDVTPSSCLLSGCISPFVQEARFCLTCGLSFERVWEQSKAQVVLPSLSRLLTYTVSPALHWEMELKRDGTGGASSPRCAAFALILCHLQGEGH